VAISISASYLFRSLGQVLGVALTGALQQAVLSSSLHSRLPASTPSKLITDIIRAPSGTIPRLSGVVREAAIWAYLDSVRAVFAFSAVLGLVMVGCAMGMRAFAMAGR
jgi:hypothetical protein